MDSITYGMYPGMLLLTLNLWALWCLVWGALLLSVFVGGMRAIFYFFRSAHQHVGIFGIAGGLAFLILLGLFSVGVIPLFLIFMALGCGTLYYTIDFWSMQFPDYFRAWCKLPLSTRILTLAFPYDLVFTLVKPLISH